MTGGVGSARRWGLPAATAAAAVVLDLLPLAPGPSPLFSLCLVYAWAVHAPERLPPPVVCLLGLVLDALGGAPLGLTALPLLLVHAGTAAVRRHLVGAPFVAAWAACGVAALLGCGTRWLLAALWWWHPFPPQPALAEALLTAAVYPLLGWPLRRPSPRPSRSGHAAGR